MIEEVVNSILEAEDEAKKRVAEAEKQAGEILAEAEIKAENIRKSSAESNKKRFADQTAAAEKEASEQAQKVLSAKNAETDAITEKYAENVEKAVKFILESKK